MSGDITPYLALIPAEHRDKPKYVAWISMLVQPFADAMAVVQSMTDLFDVDTAVGTQLDAIGEIVGTSRNLTAPLTGIYFSLDTPNLGLDEGILPGPFDPLTGIVALDDDHFRILIYATILANAWDGTTEGIYTIWDTMFSSFYEEELLVTEDGMFLVTDDNGAALEITVNSPPRIIVQDHQDMTITYGLLGSIPDAIFAQMYLSGLLTVKPAGVRIRNRLLPYAPNVPYFGLDAETDSVGGLDIGAFGYTS